MNSQNCCCRLPSHYLGNSETQHEIQMLTLLGSLMLGLISQQHLHYVTAIHYTRYTFRLISYLDGSLVTADWTFSGYLKLPYVFYLLLPTCFTITSQSVPNFPAHQISFITPAFSCELGQTNFSCKKARMSLVKTV